MLSLQDVLPGNVLSLWGCICLWECAVSLCECIVPLWECVVSLIDVLCLGMCDVFMGM